MSDQSSSTIGIDHFINRWAASGASERANYALFLTELCDLLEVPQPDPSTSDDEQNAYVFDRAVRFTEPDGTTTTGFIDLYKRGSFVLEAKQGSDQDTDEERDAAKLREKPKRKKKGTAVRGTEGWDDAMVRARGQADGYARALPVSEGWPPFVVVVDVGHCIELYSEFSRSGKAYVPFPDPRSFRIKLAELCHADIRERLRNVWTAPSSLDPSQHAAKVTRKLAQRLAELAKLLEKAGHDPARVARFLMRCLFTMFAEDVDLIPKGAFKKLLNRLRGNPAAFQPMVAELWKAMNDGTFSTVLESKLRHFNGGLFADSEALPITRQMLDLLYDAAVADWAAVEPAIFGTLLERALDSSERHKLGAHFTPRAYVERLVIPTIVEPLREDWNAVFTAAVTAARGGNLPDAQDMVRKFHERLCETRILDPACGSGNFLYVTLEHMKRLEGEVLNALREFGDKQRVFLEVDPHQFLGIEINPRAAAIAELVLWIGYLQWHFRANGKDLDEPIIRNYHNIECRDAVLAWDRSEQLVDENGQPVTRWDGNTTKKHPVTGEDVPDEKALVTALSYVNPRKAIWPKADYVIGNPPYIGVRKLRATIGREYVDALADTYPEVPETADFVMYWWHKAATLIESDDLHRFGFITTDSIVQQYSRPAIDLHLNANPGVQIIYAIDEHPWVEDRDGAAVQVAMTVVAHSFNYKGPKRLGHVTSAAGGNEVEVIVSPASSISSLLRSDLDMRQVKPLNSNASICFQGVIPGNDGFKFTENEFSVLGITRGRLPTIVRRYVIGKDIVRQHEDKWVIDCFGLTEADVADKYPKFYQWLLDRVKPERDQNPRETRRKKWWLFAENAPKLRRALDGLTRYIATPNTAKHRPFVFLESDILPDAMAYAVASDDAFTLGILSARPHQVWALQTGGTLEDRPRYNSRETFSPFPFPIASEGSVRIIRELAERLDAHRKAQQSLYPKLKLTDVYNVLQKLRLGNALTDKDKTIHEQGLVSILRQIHDDLDAAVFAVYGWPSSVTDEEILQRLVALNSERAVEEARGIVRWLRPDLQNLTGAASGTLPDANDDSENDFDETTQTASAQVDKKSRKTAVATEPPRPKSRKLERLDWPKTMDAQAKAVLAALREYDGSATVEELAARFSRANRERIAELLQTLSALGQARRRGNRYSA
jgi:hypothetical protein